MAKEPETPAPITEKPLETTVKPAETTVKPAEKADPTEQDQVKVIAQASFYRDANFQGPVLQKGDPFVTDRARAVELRGNGLISYADAAEEKEAAKDDPPPSEDNGQAVITTRSFRRPKT